MDVMSAYNKVNGTYCAENHYLLTDVLKKEFGFKGFVISDWGCTYSTAPTVNAGMDLEMPGGAPMKAMLSQPRPSSAATAAAGWRAEKVLAEMKAGHIPEATLDDNVSRILRVIFLSGLFDHPHPGGGEVDTPEQRAIALQGSNRRHRAAEKHTAPAAARCGEDQVDRGDRTQCRRGADRRRRKLAGAAQVAVAPLDGIKEKAGSGIKITYALGVGMEGEDPTQDTPEARAKALKEAVDAAANADVAVVVVGRYNKIESEGFDLKTMDLPAGQDELIQAVEKANPHTIVVLNTGDPVTMTNWIDQTPALLDMWYGGQEGGHALAAVLFGDANPSGKLPVSLPKKFEDSPAYGHYPGENLKSTTPRASTSAIATTTPRTLSRSFPSASGSAIRRSSTAI